jgi:hypothetical protein
MANPVFCFIEFSICFGHKNLSESIPYFP